MAHCCFRPARTALATAVLCALALPAASQGTDTITITGRSEPGSTLAGFGDAPLSSMPLQASVFGSQRLADAGATRIGDLVRFDASVGDAYNAEGYWSILSVRGYTLDNRFNYRRDGLPINAETAIAIDNKQRIEVLKGTSGIQAGTSAPGGLVNLLVKRPEAGVRSATLGWRERGTLGVAIDIGDRSGPDGMIGWRVNAAHEHLDPVTRDTRGHRRLLALAGDARLGSGTIIEAEVEYSHQSQPSVAGFSMLGNTVPDAAGIDPRINLNRQPWSQPVVMQGSTVSLRLQQKLAADWRFTAHAMTQRLKSDDRTAFPYGVYDASYACPDWCDRYAPDGSFSYWEYVSNDERRNSSALDLSVAGSAVTAGIRHQLQAGVLFTRYTGRFQDQVFDLAGTGNIRGTLDGPPSSGFLDANTDRDERSAEAYLRDAMRLGDAWQLWAGVRHTRIERESRRTSPDGDGSLRPTDVARAFTLPWLALSYAVSPRTLVYASWGEGLETDVAPNRPRYANAGQSVTLKSRQVEVGVKHDAGPFDLAVTAFDIDRPQSTDAGSCDAADTCVRQIDGSARHRGLEAQLGWRQGAWRWQASAMLLDAARRGSAIDTVNGLRPVNVPGRTLRLATAYQVAGVPGLELQAALQAEGDRMVLPDDNGVRIPGWAKLDLGARWQHRLAGADVTWRVAVDNVTDRRAWKESPYQFGHVYLYPVAPRTWRTSMSMSF